MRKWALARRPGAPPAAPHLLKMGAFVLLGLVMGKILQAGLTLVFVLLCGAMLLFTIAAFLENLPGAIPRGWRWLVRRIRGGRV